MASLRMTLIKRIFFGHELFGPKRGSSTLSVSCHFLVALRVHAFSNFIAHIPEGFVKNMLLTLTQYFNRCSHGADHASANDSLSQLQMQEAKELNILIKIEQLLGSIMQA